MIKMSSNKFLVMVMIPINILISFLMLYFFEFSQEQGNEFFRPSNMVLVLAFLINTIILTQTIRRIKQSKKEKLEIEFKRRKSILVAVIVFSILSIIASYFSFILKSLVLLSLVLFLILLVINGVISLKMLSGISSSYVFYNGRQISIEDIESYDIDSRNINIRTSNTLFFINVFEITSIPNENNNGEKFEQIISNNNNPII